MGQVEDFRQDFGMNVGWGICISGAAAAEDGDFDA